MILETHILLAIISVTSATYTAILPSRNKLLVTYLLATGTILSGTAMLFTSPQELGRVCLSGFVFIGLIVVTSVIAKNRLTLSKINEETL